MAEEWKEGDRALCVKDKGWTCFGEGLGPKKGQVHEVTRVFPREMVNVVVETHPSNEFLSFAPWEPKSVYGSACFVKVTPQEEDQFDREVIEQGYGKLVKCLLPLSALLLAGCGYEERAHYTCIQDGVVILNEPLTAGKGSLWDADGNRVMIPDDAFCRRSEWVRTKKETER